MTAAARGAAVRAAPLEAARARALEGVALAHAGDRRRGVAALKHAANEFQRFGAHRLRDQTTRELRRLGLRTWRRGPTTPRHAQGIHSLSPREREVAELVLGGKRNTEIARELFLSLKTVESHTRNIYAKLGVRSRVEFIARLSQPPPVRTCDVNRRIRPAPSRRAAEGSANVTLMAVAVNGSGRRTLRRAGWAGR